MLDIVRKYSKSWGIKVVFGAIILVFIGWGGYAYQTRHEYDIARVGDHYISTDEYQTAFSNLQEAVRKQFGGAVPEEYMRALNLKEQALQLLIEHHLIMRGARELGLTATTDEVRRRILEMQVFQSGGKFDSRRYEGALRQMRLTPDVFEQQVSTEIAMQKVESFIMDRALVTEDEILTEYHLNRDQIKVSYVVFDPKSFEETVTVDEQALRTFYQNNQNRYMEPEQREIAYVLVSREEIEKEIHPSEEEIKRYYEDNVARFTHEKQVRAQHILLRVKPDAPRAEVEKVRARLAKILEEAKKGKDFAELAMKYSEDEATAKKGGELGFFSSEQMTPAFSKAAFDLKPGEISDIVQTPYGFHIIKAEEITEPRTAPFDEVKSEIEKEIKSQDAKDLAFKQMRNLRDLAYARKDIARAAAEMKMTVSDPVWITASENQGDSGPFPAAIRAKLFELGQGDISDMLELPKGFATAQVKSIKRPQPIPFESVRDKVTKDFRADRAKELAQKRASEVLAQAVDKKSLAAVAKEQNINLRQSGFFSRQEPDKDLKLLWGASLNSVFSLQDSKPLPELPLELGNTYMVCQLEGKNPAGEPSQEEKAEIFGRMLRQKQKEVWKAWLMEVGKTTKIERLKKI